MEDRSLATAKLDQMFGNNRLSSPQPHGTILRRAQRRAVLDPSVCRADIGKACNGERRIRRPALESAFLNNVPRNYVTGPGFNNIDTSFFKDTPITERVKLRVEAQIFNLLNHKNWANPNTSGIVTAGVGNPRIAQFQGRLEF